MEESQHLRQKFGLKESASLIMGSMIGSGIFIVPAEMAMGLHSVPLLMISWLVAAIITICGALCYGELSAAMPHAGGQYVYLKKIYNPLMGFLFGWSTFAIIQTGTIAAVGVAFAKFSGVFFPIISSENVIFDVGFIHFSTQQLLGIIMIWVLTVFNFNKVESGAWVQNILTWVKILSLLVVIGAGLYFISLKTIPIVHYSADFPKLDFNLGVFCAAMVGALFSADAWNNITYTAGEIKDPQRNIPRALIIGTGTVLALYILINLIYINTLPIQDIANAPQQRVATLMMEKVMGESGKYFMAALIMVSTFGCLNGIILSGARVYYAMAQDGLFFSFAKKLNKNSVPQGALLAQGVWASALVLSGSYGQLLTYVIFAVLLFYILTIFGIFIHRKKFPNDPRPYKVILYPILPWIYIILAGTICVCLLIFKPNESLPGLGLVLFGLVIYWAIQKRRA